MKSVVMVVYDLGLLRGAGGPPLAIGGSKFIWDMGDGERLYARPLIPAAADSLSLSLSEAKADVMAEATYSSRFLM